MSKPFIRNGYSAVSPYLIVKGAASLLAFLKEVFDAEEIIVMPMPNGKIAHASVRLHGAVIELADANDQWPAMPASLHVYVPEADATFARAIKAGAISVMEPADMFYGERSGTVSDSWGNQWHIATMQAELSNEEIEKRASGKC